MYGEGHMALSGPRMYAEGLEASLKSLTWAIPVSDREMTPYTRVRREALSVARSNEQGENAQRR